MEIKRIKKKLDKLWREIVLKRAGYKCEICGKETKYLNAHHIEGRSASVRWDLDNGICLCPYCHTFGYISAHSVAYSGQVEFHKRLKKVRGSKLLKEIKIKRNKVKKWTKKELENLLNEFKKKL